jgi:hypothetical protein
MSDPEVFFEFFLTVVKAFVEELQIVERRGQRRA